MTDFDSWPPLFKLAFLIGPFAIGFLGLAINVQIAVSRDYKVALSAITSNPYLEQMKPVWGRKPEVSLFVVKYGERLGCVSQVAPIYGLA